MDTERVDSETSTGDQTIMSDSLNNLRSYIDSASGRRVVGYGCPGGIILRWEPLTAALCDVLVLFDDNTECWFGLTDLRPFDARRPLPNRAEALRLSRIECTESLTQIRANLIRDWNTPWPGINFGKAHLGMAINAALESVA